MADKVGFAYNKNHSQKYADLITSIKRIDDYEISKRRTETKLREKIEPDQDVINAISKAICSGITSKFLIVKNVNEETGLTQKTSGQYWMSVQVLFMILGIDGQFVSAGTKKAPIQF